MIPYDRSRLVVVPEVSQSVGVCIFSPGEHTFLDTPPVDFAATELPWPNQEREKNERVLQQLASYLKLVGFLDCVVEL